MPVTYKQMCWLWRVGCWRRPLTGALTLRQTRRARRSAARSRAAPPPPPWRPPRRPCWRRRRGRARTPRSSASGPTSRTDPRRAPRAPPRPLAVRRCVRYFPEFNISLQQSARPCWGGERAREIFRPFCNRKASVLNRDLHIQLCRAQRSFISINTYSDFITWQYNCVIINIIY